MLALAATCFLPCTPAVAQGISQKVQQLEFPYAGGFFGADDAYSVPLSPTRSLWLFGDTFVGDATTKTRAETKAMIRNSLAITDCRTGAPCHVEYIWGGQGTDKPRSFFDTGKEDEWYWPSDAYRDGNKLYIALMIVRTKSGMKADEPFGFELAGTHWVVVQNALDEPAKWKMTSKDVTDGSLWLGVSMVREGKYVYLYSQRKLGTQPGYMVVLRVPARSMSDPVAHAEYLAKDHAWRKGLPQQDAAHVIEQPISEMSVRYHPSRKKWIAIATGPEFPSTRAVVRFADAVTGPWTEAQTLYEFPETKPSFRAYDKDTFCYAAKEHIEFSEQQIALTYACNSFVLKKTLAIEEIYRPQYRLLTIPPVTEQHPGAVAK